MPGGRLTAQDRQRVASGLAEGLGYAEIARQMGRPTSTISREVARNGGPNGYRAGNAHQATRRRARRRKSAPSSDLPAATQPHGRDPEAVRGFMEQFVSLMVQTGLPQMASRVFACLVTTDSGTLTAAELVQQLRVSPASVSKAIGYLEGLGLVRRERALQQRRERYIIDDDLWLRTWMTDARRHESWASTAQQGTQIFGAATPAGARLDQMSRFFAQLANNMAGGPITAATMPTLEDAIMLAAYVHRGQIYPSPDGEPYILHPLRVMLRLESEVERIVAVLHDILEDTSYPLADLREAGFQDDVLAALEHLTRRDDEAYDAYIDRVAEHPLARRVKLADIAENLANNRRLHALLPDPQTQERIERYECAVHRLLAVARA